MRRCIKKLAEKVLDISRPTSPDQGNSTPKSDGKPDGLAEAAKTGLAEGLRVVKQALKNIEQESLIGAVTELIEFAQSTDFAIDNAALARFNDELMKLSDALRLVKSDRTSTEIEKQADNLAREIDNATKSANVNESRRSIGHYARRFTDTTAFLKLCDNIKAATQNFLQQSSLISVITSKSTARTVSGRVVGTLSIVKESLDGVPVVGLKGAIGGFLEALKALNNVIDSDDDLIKLIDHINRLVKIVTPSATDEFDLNSQTRVDNLIRDVQCITAEAERLQNQNLGSKFTGSADNANAIAGLVQSIDQTIDRFQVAGTIWVERSIGKLNEGAGRMELGINRLESGVGNLDLGIGRVEDGMGFVGDKLVKVEAQLERIGTTPKNSDEEAALSAIQPRANNARYNSASQTSSSFCLPNTRVEILSEILQWANNAQDDRPMFWLSGMAGTGKSTIARTVAKSLDDNGLLGASFFFSRDEAERRSTARVFTTIAYELARSRPLFRDSIIAASNPDTCTAMMRTQMEKLIMGPLQAFEGQVASPLVFILDALDECSNQDHITELIVLLSYLLRDLRPKINVKIMVTGRPEAHIRGQFMSPTLESISSISHLHDIDRSIVGSDIRLYLDHHLNKIKYEMLPGMASWPQEGEMDALVRMADGLFIYASAAVTYLRVQPIKRMKIILASVQHQKATSAFRHLDALYRQILQSAETLDPDADEEDGAEILEELHTILGTIVVLLDPLCARSLELLLGLEQGTVQPALRPFHSVLSISSPPYPIRVFHKSFPDFLSDQGRSDVNSWYHVDTKKHHTRLALLCLNHMNVMLQRDMCGVGDLEKNEIPDLERLLDEKVKPHLLYACHHWGTHLSQAEHSEALDGALHNLCMTKLLHWLEILSLTGKLNTGVQALTLVKDWCDPNNVVLGTILNDCYRFLLLFRDIFAIGPSHIYQSGLPFMPDCELFNIMQKEANVTVKYGKPQGWSNILFRLQMDSESFIRSISISPDCTLVAVGFMGGDISIWSTKYGTLLRTFDVGRIWLNAEALAFSPDGAYLASGNSDGTIAILDAKTGVLRHKANVKDYQDLKGSPFDNSVKRILFAPNGNHFATVSQSLATITIWNATNCNRIHQFHAPNPTVAAIAFSPDSNKLVAFCFEDTGILFDVVTGRVIDEIALNFYHYSAIAFSPDGNHIAVANPCPELTWMAIWDISSSSFVFPDISESVLRRKGIRIGKPDMDFQFSYLMYSVDGTQLSCYSSAGEVRIWDAKTGDLLQSFRNHVFYESPCFVSLSPDASLIASTRGIDRMIVVGAAQTPIQNDPGEIPLLEQVRSLVFSPDGAVIASISSERVIYLWDPHTAVCTTTFKSFDFSRAIPKAVFSPDGTKLAAVSTEWQNGFDVQILDVLDKGVESIKFGNDGYKAPKCGELDTIAFSPDGNQFVLSSELGGIVIWDTISGNRIRSFPAQTDARVRSLLFSPDGTLLFSGCSNNMIMAWSITTGELCKSLMGHTESVSSLMISPDDRLISRDKSGKIIYWNVDDLEPIGEGQVPEVYSDEDYYDPTSTSQKIELFHRNGQIVRISGGVCRPLCGLVGHEVISSASYGSVFAYGTDSGEFYIVDFSKALAS